MIAAARLLAGGTLAWCVGAALLRPDTPALARIAGILVAGLTLMSPAAGLTAAVALAPAGLLLAEAPASVAELTAWAFTAAWLLSIWRPMSTHALGDRALMPALLYGACVLASWLGYTVGLAGGVDPPFIPLLLLRTLPGDHILYSSPEPETWTLLQTAAGIALYAAALVLSAAKPALRRWIVVAVVASMALLALLTAADVLRQWATAGYDKQALLRYVEGSRFSLHVADLNAAGSQYVLGGLMAVAMAAADSKRRWIWIAAALAMLPALWLSGSRSAALGALIVGGSLIPIVRHRVPVRIAPAAIVLLLVLIAAAAGVVAASGQGEQGTASNALRLRSQFLLTSARMFASSPVFGVGAGHYHERSNEFMPPALREVYRHENAHNYFAQQFAELGLVGGALFCWLVASVLIRGWRALRLGGAEPATLGLFTGCAGYLVTCVTGHPLLVPEAALPFWGAFGALAGVMTQEGSAETRPPQGRSAQAVVAFIVAAVLVTGVALQVRRYRWTSTAPGERGFYGPETSERGTSFNWMTRHGVFYVGPQPGTLTIPVQAPAFLRRKEPFALQVEVGGKRAGTWQPPPGVWTNIQIPIRDRTSSPFRQVDLRVNQSWTPMKDRGASTDDGPRSLMVGEIRWAPPGAR